MSDMQRALEDEAEVVVRHAARGWPPADAGTVSYARDLIGRAYRLGRTEALRDIRAVLADMHDDWGETDPLAMRDALEGFVAPEVES